MFSQIDLHRIREYEVAFLARHLAPKCRLLELGAGTGHQAKLLADLGHDVSAIDLPASTYSAMRVYPVQDYDGRTIPFPDGTFDVVFSSNVLEHIPDLPSILREIGRVLKRDGYCLHAMPSPAWRFWTLMSGPVDVVRLTANHIAKRDKPLRLFLRHIASRFRPHRHGEHGNFITEFWTFSRRRWISEFQRNGFDVLAADRMGLFYTGWMAISTDIFTIGQREAAAKVLGSACSFYVVRPYVRCAKAVDHAPSAKLRSLAK